MTKIQPVSLRTDAARRVSIHGGGYGGSGDGRNRMAAARVWCSTLQRYGAAPCNGVVQKTAGTGIFRLRSIQVFFQYNQPFKH